MSVTLNKSNACSVEGILSRCSTLGGLTYMRGSVMAAIGGSRADFRNSHESVIVRMAFNAQPARSIEGDLLSLCVCVCIVSISGKRY